LIEKSPGHERVNHDGRPDEQEGRHHMKEADAAFDETVVSASRASQ
jgi:hypothetical protein